MTDTISHVDRTALPEQSRALYPGETGYVERDGVRVFWERYGEGEQTVLLIPTWEIFPARVWKCQIPFLAQRFQVITFDPRGNGRSDRPRAAAAYNRREYVEDAVAVLDATGVDRALVAAICSGTGIGLAAHHPERVAALVEFATDLPVSSEPAELAGHSFTDELDTDEGWAKWNQPYWLRDWPGFIEFFVGEMLSEPHSEKQLEDGIGWGLAADPELIVAGTNAEWPDPEESLALCARVQCPTLVVQGTADGIVGPERGPAIAAAIPGARLLQIAGGGHCPFLRDPVRVNLELAAFFSAPQPPATTWRRAESRTKRALYVSSPIGLGHAQRDLAIARELRKLQPGSPDRLARPGSRDAGPRGCRRAHPSLKQRARERVGPHAVGGDGAPAERV